jgi:hypothetical protein
MELSNQVFENVALYQHVNFKMYNINYTDLMNIKQALYN